VGPDPLSWAQNGVKLTFVGMSQQPDVTSSWILAWS